MDDQAKGAMRTNIGVHVLSMLLVGLLFRPTGLEPNRNSIRSCQLE
jgi:hypothetical protein